MFGSLEAKITHLAKSQRACRTRKWGKNEHDTDQKARENSDRAQERD